MELALLLIFPIAWPFVAKLFWPHEITFGEMAANLGVGVIIVLGGWALSSLHSTWDIQVLNGAVTGKAKVRVSCEHSYSCNCRTVCRGSGDSRQCSEVCDTCYEHSHDYDYVVRSTVGSFDIRRVDRQGTIEPSRFTKVANGDPVATTSSYTNYIKAAPDSLFHHLQTKDYWQHFAADLPKYPTEVYDYHYLDRVLASKVNVPDLAAWNLALANTLRALGPAKEANVVVVFTHHIDPYFANALEAHWLGGKKNDVVVVVGAPNYPKIEWVRLFSWTDNQLFKAQLLKALEKQPTAVIEPFIGAITYHINDSFVRKPMAEFEYLKREISPPLWLMIVLFILSVVCSVLVTRYVIKHDH